MKGLSKDDAYRTQIMFESLKEFFRDKKSSWLYRKDSQRWRVAVYV